MDGNTFAAGSAPWLARLGNLRDSVRQELASRQLSHHLPVDPSGLRVLDAGAGQGTQPIRLAVAGCLVTAVEPDEGMRARFLSPTPVQTGSERLKTGLGHRKTRQALSRAVARRGRAQPSSSANPVGRRVSA